MADIITAVQQIVAQLTPMQGATIAACCLILAAIARPAGNPESDNYMTDSRRRN